MKLLISETIFCTRIYFNYLLFERKVDSYGIAKLDVASLKGPCQNPLQHVEISCQSVHILNTFPFSYCYPKYDGPELTSGILQAVAKEIKGKAYFVQSFYVWQMNEKAQDH